MTSVKNWMVGLAAGAAAMGSVSAVADSPLLSVDKQSQTVQTPTTGSAGFSYVPVSNGTKSTLSVYSEGFLFCGNPGLAGASPYKVDLQVKHQDQQLTPSGEWLFSTATDVADISYVAGVLRANPAQDTTLTCSGTTAEGVVGAGLREGIFDNGYDSSRLNNYSHLVNWMPSAGFDWETPDWTLVPQDPCGPTSNDPARVDEDITCAALTGVRGQAAGGHVRAGAMWVANDFQHFTYVFRVDARFGAQEPGPTQMALPTTQSIDRPDAGSLASLMIYDAIDSTYLQASGQACMLTQLPATLGANVCSGQAPLALESDGLLRLPVSVGQPPLAQKSTSFYIAVVRPLRNGGGHGSNTTPVVGAAILVEAAVAREGGDKFVGDDIVFGFQPAPNAGFSWMKEPTQ